MSRRTYVSASAAMTRSACISHVRAASKLPKSPASTCLAFPPSSSHSDRIANGPLTASSLADHRHRQWRPPLRTVWRRSPSSTLRTGLSSNGRSISHSPSTLFTTRIVPFLRDPHNRLRNPQKILKGKGRRKMRGRQRRNLPGLRCVTMHVQARGMAG